MKALPFLFPVVLLISGSLTPLMAAGGFDPAWWLSESVRVLQEEREFLEKRLKSLPAFTTPSGVRTGFHSGFRNAVNQVEWVQVDLGRPHVITSIALVPASLPIGNEVAEGYGFPIQFRVQVSNDVNFSQAALASDQTAADFPNPGRYPVLVRGLDLRGRYVRVTVTKQTAEAGRAFFALGEMIVLSGNRNVSVRRPVRSSASLEIENSWSQSYLVDDQYALPLPMSVYGSTTNGFLSQPCHTFDEEHWVQVDLGRDYPIDEVRLIPARPIGQADLPGWGFPMKFRVEASRQPDFSEVETFCDYSSAEVRYWTDRPMILPADTRLINTMDFSVTQPTPDVFPARPVLARYVRLTATRLDTRLVPSFLALAEMQVYSQDVNVASQGTVSFSDSAGVDAGRRWSPDALIDDFTSRSRLLEFPAWLEQIERRREMENSLRDISQQLETAVVDVWLQVGFTIGGSGLFLITSLVWFNWRQTRRMRSQTEELRTQIASDLHDDIGSNLGTIALLVQTMRHQEGVPEELRSELEEIRDVALETGDAMRDIVWLLRPTASRLDDFAQRLRTTVSRLLPGLSVTFQCPEELPGITVALNWRRNVFLSFKESLHNISRHSRATTVSIRVNVLPDRMVIEISDNGVGFDPALATDGLGRISLGKRLTELGGTVEFLSAPGSGTTVRIEAPFLRPRPRWMKWLPRFFTQW
jgi:signal transduction histidine kinase